MKKQLLFTLFFILFFAVNLFSQTKISGFSPSSAEVQKQLEAKFDANLRENIAII